MDHVTSSPLLGDHAVAVALAPDGTPGRGLNKLGHGLLGRLRADLVEVESQRAESIGGPVAWAHLVRFPAHRNRKASAAKVEGVARAPRS
ncbi:hypothetical protein U1Q18_052058 [Sarracenia purpurea var. burkii]